jgi:hypothetical protein
MLWLLIVVGRSTLYWAARKKNPRTPGKSARRPLVAVWRRLSVVVWRRLASSSSSSLLSFASTTASVADIQMSATAAAIAVVARWVRELVATIKWWFLQLLWLWRSFVLCCVVLCCGATALIITLTMKMKLMIMIKIIVVTIMIAAAAAGEERWW